MCGVGLGGSIMSESLAIGLSVCTSSFIIESQTDKGGVVADFQCLDIVLHAATGQCLQAPMDRREQRSSATSGVPANFVDCISLILLYTWNVRWQNGYIFYGATKCGESSRSIGGHLHQVS